MSEVNTGVTHIVEPVDEEEAVEPVMPYRPPPAVKAKRKNVIYSSSEPVDVDYKIVVIPKSDSAKTKITEIIGKNFLFSKLDESQKKIVVGFCFELFVNYFVCRCNV
jgi:hypothetical protein